MVAHQSPKLLVAVQLCTEKPNILSVLSVGRRPALEAGGRRFESYLSDQISPGDETGIHVGLRHQILQVRLLSRGPCPFRIMAITPVL